MVHLDVVLRFMHFVLIPGQQVTLAVSLSWQGYN